MQIVGFLDKKKLGNYRYKIINSQVIITSERIQHIKKRHPGDYEEYIEYVYDIIKNPDYILEDKDNKDTILILKSILDNGKNIQIVIKLQTNKQNNEKYNSILTFWHMRDRTYRQTIKNNKIIFQKLDNNE